MTKNISSIEKCAKLMGWEVLGTFADGTPNIMRNGTINNSFNPLTNKSDLMDLECALMMSVTMFPTDVIAAAWSSSKSYEKKEIEYADHPDKFTARAHAVIAVAVQIYDKQFGGE